MTFFAGYLYFQFVLGVNFLKELNDIKNINNSKLKTYNILSKIFIIVFVFINFINFIPLRINDPQWSSGVSLYFIDTFSILTTLPSTGEITWLSFEIVFLEGFLKNCNIKRLYAKRERRFFDKSKLSILALINHSLRVNCVFYGNIFFVE